MDIIARYKGIIAPTIFVIVLIVILIVPDLFETVTSFIADNISNKLAWFGALIAVTIGTARKVQEIRED